MSRFDFRETARTGILAGIVALSVSAIGMVETFDQRDLITDVFTLGQLLLFAAPLLAGFLVARRGQKSAPVSLAEGLVAGLVAVLPLLALLAVEAAVANMRDYLVNVSQALVNILLFQRSEITGSLLLAITMTGLGGVGALLYLLPDRVKRPLILGVAWTLGLATFSDVLLNIFQQVMARNTLRIIFGSKGITPLAAAVVFILAVLISAGWGAGGQRAYTRRRESMSPGQQRNMRLGSIGLGVLLLLALPWIVGVYVTEVLDVVLMFALMGFGLNIVVGFAGLLDLGYVAFFAIGAYVMGILTSAGALGVASMSFWEALPFSIGASVLAGVILGIPVLRMRGDYLAIVTLGFGEIIRVLATSDLLKPYIGGAQGVLQITKPQAFDFTFVQPQHFYYLFLLGCFLAAFVSWRLRDARLGRRWMAMREDEDVAEAMGINLVKTKLLAFGIGAAFSGLAGAVFASRLSSIFPHSFNILISINVLCLIIVGGIGSLPGVVVGSLFLVGMPELLREFAEYRLLLYGALLIVMMVRRPEGIWPSPVVRREMHAAEEEFRPAEEGVTVQPGD